MFCCSDFVSFTHCLALPGAKWSESTTPRELSVSKALLSNRSFHFISRVLRIFFNHPLFRYTGTISLTFYGFVNKDISFRFVSNKPPTQTEMIETTFNFWSYEKTLPPILLNFFPFFFFNFYLVRVELILERKSASSFSD